MKILLLIALIVFSFHSLAQKNGADQSGGNPSQQTGDNDDNGGNDEWESGSDEYDFERFSNENVLAMIENDMEMACGDTGLCTLHAVTQSDRRFTATFSVGEGSPLNGIGGQDGSVIITDGSNGLLGAQEYWGVQFQFTTGTCTQSIKVPRSLYLTMNRYFYDFIDEQGNTRRGFDPSKEAMIMFYTTIVKQANGCNTGR